MDDLINK